jgi:hypothetical protein
MLCALHGGSAGLLFFVAGKGEKGRSSVTRNVVKKAAKMIQKFVAKQLDSVESTK